MDSLTVLGGGNTAFAVAANLTLLGHRITLWEIPSFEHTLDPIRDSNEIKLDGVANQGPAKIHRLTTDIADALNANDLVLVIVPSYAHEPFIEACAPHLRTDHTVVLMPGNLGSLAWSHRLRELEASLPTLAEVDTAPYVCRKTQPDTATIWGEVTGLGLGVLPHTRTDQVRARLDALFPGVTVYPDVMACGLSAMNPVVHPAGVLMNAGRVEYSRGEFYFYEEGVTPTVANVIMKVDEERRAVGRALGYELKPANEAFHAAGFSPQGDMWAAINGSRMLTALKAPGSLESRWLTEDIPFGLASWSSVGNQYGVATPTIDAFVNIGTVVMGFDAWEAAREVSRLGIKDASLDALRTHLKTGSGTES
ncbi:MAG: NAD/NADP octopine/nopaline dehydrogenase family protein [Planctomycetales bacterium]